MAFSKFLYIIIILASPLSFWAQKQEFRKLHTLLGQGDYFTVQRELDTHTPQLTEKEHLLIEAVLDNAFNRLLASEHKIKNFLGPNPDKTDSLNYQLLRLQTDNLLKQYRYREAMQNCQLLLNNYAHFCSPEEQKDLENDLKIWAALQDVPPQTVEKTSDCQIKMKKDRAGLGNLVLHNGKDSVSFIFDTGANISTITRSTANKLHMQLIPATITVGTITGKEVKAELAVCETLYLDNIRIQHAVFLVLEDVDLSFPEISYTIHGILGYPVLEALGEIHLSQDGTFFVPLETTVLNTSSNLAMDGLTPLIELNELYFSFDTGAGSTILYEKYYRKYRKDIKRNGKKAKLGLGGAGGAVQTNGYLIDFTVTINNKPVTVQHVQVLPKKLKPNERAYGNIGQDLISQFETLVLNFRQMYVGFE